MDRFINEIVRFIVFCILSFVLCIVGCIPVSTSNAEDFLPVIGTCLVGGFVTYVCYWFFRGFLNVFDCLD